MNMNIGRTLPPVAAPIVLRDVVHGVVGAFRGKTAVREFGRQVTEHFHARLCLLVSSGTTALTLILEALRDIRSKRDEVLIPAFTCYTVPSAVIRAGLKVRLCDVDSATLDCNHKELEALLEESPRLLAVVPTHLFGVPVDIERTTRLATPHKIFVVEDAAQAMCGEGASGPLGTLGDVGFFSLGRGKVLSTVEGGIVLTNNDEIAAQVRRKIDHLPACTIPDLLRLLVYSLALVLLRHPALYWFPKALPFLKLGETHFDCNFPLRRYSGFQAGLATGWKRKLERLRRMRRVLTLSRYSRLPSGVRPMPPLTDVPLLRFPGSSRWLQR